MADDGCITQGTTADGTQAGRLIEGWSTDHLFADKGYGSDAFLELPRRRSHLMPRPLG